MNTQKAIDQVWKLVNAKRIKKAKEVAYKNGVYMSECFFTGDDGKEYIKYHVEDDAIVYSANETFIIN